MCLFHNFQRIEQNSVISSWKDAVSSGRFKDQLSKHIELPQYGCFKDIRSRTIENEDYTIGKLIEYHLFDKLFSDVVCYIGFKKFHPHDVESVLRLAYKKNVDKQMITTHLIQSCSDAINAIKSVQKLF